MPPIFYNQKANISISQNLLTLLFLIILLQVSFFIVVHTLQPEHFSAAFFSHAFSFPLIFVSTFAPLTITTRGTCYTSEHCRYFVNHYRERPSVFYRAFVLSIQYIHRQTYSTSCGFYLSTTSTSFSSLPSLTFSRDLNTHTQPTSTYATVHAI